MFQVQGSVLQEKMSSVCVLDFREKDQNISVYISHMRMRLPEMKKDHHKQEDWQRFKTWKILECMKLCFLGMVLRIVLTRKMMFMICLWNMSSYFIATYGLATDYAVRIHDMMLLQV